MEHVGPAIIAAARWARQFLISKRGFEAAIGETASEPAELIRVRSRGRARRIIVRQASTESRARNVLEPLDPSWFDPWAESSETLAVKTRQLSRCQTCAGEKRVRCLTCQGIAMVSCGICSGSGFTWSPRSRRMIGCRVCRKSGKRICSCRDGWTSCAACSGKGKVEEWLEVAEESFDRVTFVGSDLLAQAFPGGMGPDTFDTDPHRFTIPLALSWKGQSIKEAPAEVRSALHRPDLVGISPKEDRIHEIIVQVFQSKITTVVYQLGGISGSILVQGWNQQIVENSSSRQPFQRRRRRTVQGMSIAVLASAALTIWYGVRHSFFVSTPNYWLLWICAFVLGVCFIPLMFWWALPVRGRGWKGALAAGFPALFVVLAQTGLAATGGPSLDHARAAAERGQLEDALRESAACFDLGIQAEPAGRFHDQLQLGRVRQTREPQKAWEAASLPFLTKAGREQAQAHAVAAIFQASSALQERGELSASAALLDSAPAELKQTEPLIGLRRRLYLDDALPLRKVIGSRGKSLEEKLVACTAIAPYVQGLTSLPPTPADTSLAKEIKEECEALREQGFKKVERQREAATREAEQALRRTEAAKKVALRRWALAPLLCNDGTRSPSCVCGGSHRGCCSWHGGVGGCSARYPS